MKLWRGLEWFFDIYKYARKQTETPGEYINFPNNQVLLNTDALLQVKKINSGLEGHLCLFYSFNLIEIPLAFF